jgi:HEPN domain-containing protein
MALARADLAYAEESLSLGDRFSDKVCFHCQQASEKALKALLTAHGIRSPKTHDLRALLTAVSAFLPNLLDTLAGVVDLTDYAVEIRYPDEWYAPNQAETQHALDLARMAVGWVERNLEDVTCEPPCV